MTPTWIGVTTLLVVLAYMVGHYFGEDQARNEMDWARDEDA